MLTTKKYLVKELFDKVGDKVFDFMYESQIIPKRTFFKIKIFIDIILGIFL